MGDLANTTDYRWQLAVDWHGGQTSALYAIASTGGLTRGTVRPSYPEDSEPGHPPAWRKATDDEWDADLLGDLHLELMDVCKSAIEQGLLRDAGIAEQWFREVDAAYDAILDRIDG